MDETAAINKKHMKGSGERSEDDEECDGEAWDMLRRSFREAQSVLDENRALIEQVNENHWSKNPENMVKNVGLIQKINGNISKVMSIYSDLSINFSNIVHQRRIIASTTKNENRDGKEEIAGDSAEHAAEKSQ